MMSIQKKKVSKAGDPPVQKKCSSCMIKFMFCNHISAGTCQKICGLEALCEGLQYDRNI